MLLTIFLVFTLLDVISTPFLAARGARRSAMLEEFEKFFTSYRE